MFGAAAGSWIYDSFFRGGFGGSQAFGGQGYQDSMPTREDGAGDFGGDSGGGDFA
jgi:hypothetical protein